MFPKHNPTSLPAWKKLNAIYSNKSGIPLRGYFEQNKNRVRDFSLNVGAMHLDYSKNHIDASSFKELIQLADQAGLSGAIQAMKSGEAINEREGRAVLHTALRSPKSEIKVDGNNVMPLVRQELDKLKKISTSIHSGDWKGYSGKSIKYVVNIGIGGSDLGPQMVCNALRPYWTSIKPYFLSNIDAAQWMEIKDEIVAEETVFIVASKTFTTDETMTNAQTVRSWFVAQTGSEDAISKHFFAVSTNLEEVSKFGIPAENIVGFWDWVGGRFSLWSSIGLSIAITVGFDGFKALLAGGNEMDEHLFSAPFEKNMPVIMALLTLLQVNFQDMHAHAILPYDHRLRDFPRFLQQLIMESNGKQVDRNGQRVDYSTCPVYFGEPGTNGQHAFYQLLHQGTEAIPADFIAFRKPAHGHAEHHQKLLANCFAQSEALMDGSKNDDSFKNFEGNRPSNTLLIDELSPENLGALIALYEHIVFVQGVLWNVYSFDQWGVELGKVLAKKIVSGAEESSNASTRSLLSRLKD
jgi:glucose-6-phosphate isomerase